MEYEIVKRNFIKNEVGQAVETLTLIPKLYVARVTVSPDDQANLEELKMTLAKSIAEELVTNLVTDVNPKGFKSYSVSTVLYNRPKEKELYEMLRREYQLNDKLNTELYDFRKLMKSPWKLFKEFFKLFRR